MTQDVLEPQKAAMTRKSLFVILLEGCGASVLLMLRYAWPHLSPLHVDLYHRILPMNTVYGAVAIDLVIACLFCTGIFWLLERFDPDGNTLWWVLVAAILLAKALSFTEFVVVWVANLDVSLAGLRFLPAACLAAVCVLWLWKRLWYSKVVRGARWTLALLGVCIVWMLPQLVYMAVRPEPHDVQKFVRTVSPARAPQRRVVWILFDELSQDQTFDHRQPGMSLPQLDQFRSQSVMFSDVQPAGYYTENVVPSLLWGKVITGIRSDLSGNFIVKTSNRWQRFPTKQSLFADAQRDGWSTGVAGWANPYCRTYGASLDWCAWVKSSGIDGNYSREKSLWWNVNAPIMRTEAKLAGRRNPIPADDKLRAAEYGDLMRWSHELIDDGNIGFVFLHLPLPHPSGFYNRKTGQIGVHGSYLDNLALTDRTLGELMRWISQTPLASQTTVIVCSDHSWRVKLWNRTSAWTKEDEEASGGRFDPRPVLMVHFPGETAPKVVGEPFAAIREHDLVESLLHGAMTPEELEGWAHGK